MTLNFDARDLVAALKAAAEPTRLRILGLLSASELNVKDLTQILGQSQPRISRHLKLLNEAGLIERFREGSWVYFYVADGTRGGQLVRRIIDAADEADSILVRDQERAQVVKREREVAAQAFFEAHAADWDEIRSFYVAEAEVEAAILDMLGAGPFELLVDLGTGTGRILELLGDRYAHGLGIDLNQAMLAYARSKLSSAGLDKAQVRHGDLYNLTLEDHAASAVVMHQVLHFLSDPARAIDEAARVLAPGGKLLIVDFAPHAIEELRERFAHERLGFATQQIEDWMRAAGLKPGRAHTLAPPASGAGDQLTVSIWIAEKGRAAGRARARTPAQRKLERAE
ncbi:MAG TPA: metalloregulator ArsR/SmtB family transcription factor [Hyphomicrobiaceae bacterium]|nr:metalloregulator ArsR/SmtB family transcription factor [Hyphomicrobiaceae bacterium]